MSKNEEAIRENEAKKERERPRIMKQYGLKEPDDATITDILRAEAELEHCAKCNGECTKKTCKDMKPTVEVANGTAYIPYGRCKFGALRALNAACRRLQIPKKFVGKTLKDYEKTPGNKAAVGIAKWFIETKPERSLYYFGECGTGKTYLAAIIAQEYIMDYKSVVFGDVPALMEELKRTFDGKGGDSSQDVLDRYKDCDLLILDDIGAGQITEWNVGILYQIINDRYTSGKPMVITSNFDLDELEARLKSKDKFSATRIVSRLHELCEVGNLGDKDRRR